MRLEFIVPVLQDGRNRNLSCYFGICYGDLFSLD